MIDKQQVISLYREGWTAKEIAKEVGCTPVRINQILSDRRGYDSGRKVLPHEREDAPDAPPLSRRGTYSKPELYAFLVWHREHSTPFHAVARTLGVPLDRITYVMGLGWETVFRDILEAKEAA